MACLRMENEIEFSRGIQAFTESNGHEMLPELFSARDGNDTLLITAVKHDLVTAVEYILGLGADINVGYEKVPIQFACFHGHWRSLELLLKSSTINVHTRDPLLVILVKNYSDTTNKCNYEKCLQMLLENEKKICIDWQDEIGCTALHYAAIANNSHVLTELLNWGAHLGAVNIYNQYAISNVSPTVFEKHLDSCITTNQECPWDSKFEIRFDYKNLVQRSIDKNVNNCMNEMAPICFMPKSNNLKHLIEHPLISMFLSWEWSQIANVFYVNFILCTLFMASIVTYIWLCHEEIFYYPLRIISFCLLSYIMLREFIQFILSPVVYMKNWHNGVEILLIISSIETLTSNYQSFKEIEQRTLSSFTILLSALEISIVAGSMPFWSFSVHYETLFTVTKTYLKGVRLYAIILLAFSFGFFILFQTMIPNETAAGTKSNFSMFGNIGLSIMKTIMMFVGELDADDIGFNKNPCSYSFFLLFVFLISILLSNLLSGLAVKDTPVSECPLKCIYYYN